MNNRIPTTEDPADPIYELRADNICAGYALGRAGRSRWRGWLDSPSRPGGTLVLDNISITIPAGTRIGLRADPNSGKTTLARVLAGHIEPLSGHVTCNGTPVAARKGAPHSDIHLLTSSPRQQVDPQRTLAQFIAEPLLTSTAQSLPPIENTAVLRSATDGTETTAHSHDAIRYVWSRESHAAHAAALNHLTTTDEVRSAADFVKLTTTALHAHPEEVCLADLRRAAFARLLLAHPAYLICDEATTDEATTELLGSITQHLASNGTGILITSRTHDFLAACTDAVTELATL
ncbi:ABC transporter ATP-binding protein [Dermatophilus congolensis]|uniref:ABC transporter ATP-binding protein n=1 Tax=Dermatophilus congolensis TaxID=1863 RepID=UPI001AAE5DB0|nr:ATP-binding cassette domain-containing protein [Dermatophilus congolensis]MBO3142810.1 ATP-binding cassette domain-containing protein [Dermatophilus congolensis]MBO3151803.1 ATP-binding cassette domain-containing protein [Dermatophilus congolensis]MBO3161194.1 ATP-binding cassette domain-containing protein [Dermatophilus congolensis]MBO3163085.1 ATP-binding cassette domain-containing protein [Dermatophilus congolensis]MBO3176639.1 ATP-binding cassette domain-containing protein [Dermatophilu